MARQYAIRIGRILCAVLSGLLIWLTAAPALAASNPLTLTVRQHVIASSIVEEQPTLFQPAPGDGTPKNAQKHSFTYRLQPLGAGHPMPQGSGEDGFTFTLTGNTSITVGPLRFGRPGVYRYALFQVIGSKEPDVTQDRRVYGIEVYVDPTLGVALIVKNNDGEKVEEIRFANRYFAHATDPSLMADPPVKKALAGKPAKASVFQFKLTASDPAQPMPDGSANGSKTVSVTGAGEAAFGTWSYMESGIYRYTVAEINTAEKGYTYDTAVYTIEDRVEEEDGHLVLSRRVTNNAGDPAASLAFTNRYSAGGDGPATGDDTETGRYYAMLTLGGLLTAGALLFLIADRKREKEQLA